MPVSSHLESHCALAFRILSAAGALLEELLMSVHRNYPYRLFVALLDGAALDDALSDAPCTRDFFSRDWLERHDLRTREGKVSLALMAILARTEISEI
eukprot:8287307-Pyramimonas_sp.AAC.1